MSRVEATEAGAEFSFESGAATRLTQLGNRTSSKRRQHAYALRLEDTAGFRLDLDPGGGRYGADCFFCVQFYDRSHAFLGQFRAPLSSGAVALDVAVPGRAEFACFSMQLSGDGRFADVSVNVSSLNGASEPQSAIDEDRFSINAFEGLLGARPRDAETVRQALFEHGAVTAIVIATWFSDRKHHFVLQLLDASASLREPKRFNAALVWLLTFAARSFADMNATRSALSLVEELFEVDGLRSLISADDFQNLVLLHGRLLVRTGRPARAIEVFEAARLGRPTHWEAHFQLARNLDRGQFALKAEHFEAAERLLGRVDRRLVVAAVENDLEAGRLAAATSRAEAAAATLRRDHDVWLALANIHLEQDDVASWKQYLDRYFGQHALYAPRFEDMGAAGAERYFGVSAAEAAPVESQGLVAVVMTTHNSAATVELAISSVQRQSYRDLAIVVVDDCSSDGTLDIVRRLAAADPRIHVLGSDVNSGTYVCKNIALSRFEPAFFTFHDSDDWMHPARVATHVAAMRRTGTACTTSMWIRMEASGRIVPRHAGGYEHVNPASIFVGRSIVERIGYFDSVRVGADTEYVWRIRGVFGHGSVVELAEPLAIGLQHDQSLTQSGATAFDQYRFSATRLDYWESWVRWHHETLAEDPSKLHLPFPQKERRFWAPDAITPEGGRRG